MHECVAPILWRNSKFQETWNLWEIHLDACMWRNFLLLCFFLHTNFVYMKINKCLFCLMSNFWQRYVEIERECVWEYGKANKTRQEEREIERENGAADCVQINNNRWGKSQEKGWHVTLFYIDIKHANVDNVNDTISMRIRYQWLSMCTHTHVHRHRHRSMHCTISNGCS